MTEERPENETVEAGASTDTVAADNDVDQQTDEQADEQTEEQADAFIMPDDDDPTPAPPAAEAAATPADTSLITTVDGGIEEDEPMVTPGMNWFVLRVASNKEDSVKNTLLRKIKIEGMEHYVNRILVPTEKEKVVKNGKQRIIQTKLYPGYVFVEMKLEDDGRIPQDIFFLIKETTGVGDFIGTAGRPSPMSIPEIEKMMLASKPPEEQPQVRLEFTPGDHVRITGGPFENMEATVDELLPDQGKVRVIVTIFGRATPVELEHWLIDRLTEE